MQWARIATAALCYFVTHGDIEAGGEHRISTPWNAACVFMLPIWPLLFKIAIPLRVFHASQHPMQSLPSMNTLRQPQNNSTSHWASTGPPLFNCAFELGSILAPLSEC